MLKNSKTRSLFSRAPRPLVGALRQWPRWPLSNSDPAADIVENTSHIGAGLEYQSHHEISVPNGNYMFAETEVFPFRIIIMNQKSVFTGSSYVTCELDIMSKQVHDALIQFEMSKC